MSESDAYFKQPLGRRDFALLVEGTKVYVNREYLADLSPVFEKIFFPEGAAFVQPKGGVEMMGKKLDDFLIFLQAICDMPTSASVTMKLDDSNLAVLVAYADEYDVAVLRDCCVKLMSDQLKGGVEDETLIDYLRLATLYNLKDMQKQLVPLVAKLSVHQITAAHAELPTSVLAAVYQAKVLHLQGERTPTLPKGAFWCCGCHKKTRTNSKGSSSCCEERVTILTTAAAQIEAHHSFTCSQCNKYCSTNVSLGPKYRNSSCCGRGMFVKPKNQAADFSADLLDRKQ